MKASRETNEAVDSQIETGSSPAIFLGALCERDIDLLLVEEAYCSPNFLEWIVALTMPSHLPARLLEARVSTFQANGESDIEIWFEDNSGKVSTLLIENKIDASFQPDQALRYTERGKTYVRQARCSAFRTILVAPQVYLETSAGASAFETQISYESIIDWFQENSKSWPETRVQFKLCQLERAVDKARSGYCRIEDSAVTDFQNKCRALAASFGAELKLPEKEGYPARAIWIRFKVNGFGGKHEVVYKTNKGRVDFQIPGRAGEITEITPRLTPLLKNGMEICTAGKSLVVRCNAPIVAPGSPFEEQEKEIAEALLIVKNLLEWVQSVRVNLRTALDPIEHRQ